MPEIPSEETFEQACQRLDRFFRELMTNVLGLELSDS